LLMAHWITGLPWNRIREPGTPSSIGREKYVSSR